LQKISDWGGRDKGVCFRATPRVKKHKGGKTTPTRTPKNFQLGGENKSKPSLNQKKNSGFVFGGKFTQRRKPQPKKNERKKLETTSVGNGVKGRKTPCPGKKKNLVDGGTG